MFLSYTRVNVLFLPCKKAGPLIVNRNTKTRNRDTRGTLLYEISEQPTKLKISIKRGKELKKNSQKRKSGASVKWKQSLKSGEVYFAQRQQNAP